MKKLVTGLIIFLAVFLLTCIGITYKLILSADSDADKAAVSEGIDLYGTYDQNDLKILEITEDYNGVEVKLPEIDGLKNIDVQNKLNEEMRQRIYKTLNKYDKIDYSYIFTQASFANVISIEFTVADEDLYDRICFNYNLTDGSPLTLEDLFVKDADILSIVRQTFYNEFTMYKYDEESQSSYPDENELYKTVKCYMEDPNREFSFSPSKIYFYQSGNTADADMTDFANDIAIYSKYMTEESIFTGEYQGHKNIFTCADIPFDMMDKLDYGLIGENLWYDITAAGYYDENNPDKEQAERFEKFKNEMYDKTYAVLDEYKLKAQSNPDKFYIVLMKPSVSQYTKSKYNDGEWDTDFSDMATVSNDVQVFEMPAALYETVYKDKILEGYRYKYYAMRGGLYLDTENTDGAVLTQTSDSALYDYITGEELTELQDVFYPESNYMDIIESEIAERLSSEGYWGYGIDDAVLELNGIAVTATFPALDDLCVYIDFYSFDKSTMKHFD